MSKTFYLTIPLLGTGEQPTIRDLHCAVQADAISRYRRSDTHEVFTVAGTNEQALELARLATSQGVSPAQIASRFSSVYRDLWRKMRMEFSAFMQTTEPSFVEAMGELFRRLKHSRFVYVGTAGDPYCPECDIQVAGPDRVCPDCGRAIPPANQPSVFFRLSSFQEKLLGFYQDNPHFVLPAAAMTEISNLVKSGLHDVPVTTASTGWGVPVPGHDKQVFRSWVTGLAGYVSAVGFPRQEHFERFWPPDVQIMPSSALRTHAVYWPALLMAAGLEPPRHILSQRIAAGEGEAVPSVAGLVGLLPADYIKYFLLRDNPVGSDASYSLSSLTERVNNDLANELFNLASRVLKMIENYFDSTIPDYGDPEGGDEGLRRFCIETTQLYRENFDRYQISRALESVWELLSVVNKYVLANEPWVLARDRSRKDRLGGVLHNSAEALRLICVMLLPVIPDGAGSILSSLGADPAQGPSKPGALTWGELRPGTKTSALGQLFPRVELARLKAEMEDPRFKEADVAVEQKSTEATQRDDGRIGIEDFAKVEMKVARILAAERVPQSDKLLKLQVDIGSETRQVVAGIGKAYQPEALVGRLVVVVTNLKPAKLMGVVSDGMIVAASQGGVPVLVGFHEPVEVGVRLR